tara:strand:- start:1591 stop:1980 length:390 start_codon:yes stop_codon:yes gene_type:complete
MSRMKNAVMRTHKNPVEDTDGCHYGCWFGGRCMGAAREDVLGFLAAEYKKDYERKLENLTRAPNWHLNEELADMFDDGYNGPTHVSIDDVDAKCRLEAMAEQLQSDPEAVKKAAFFPHRMTRAEKEAGE